jgi:predicted phosphodiesterase
VGLADILLVGHFHHLRVETYGDSQTMFVAPSMDGGSGWFTNTAGESSRPGVLTFMVDGEGWRDMHVAWA